MSQPLETTTCPKCGHQQPGGDECLRCGVVFAKARPAAEAPRPVPTIGSPVRVDPSRAPRASIPPEPQRQISRAGWLFLILVAVVTAAVFEANHEEQVAQVTEAAAAAALGSEALPEPPQPRPVGEVPRSALHLSGRLRGSSSGGWFEDWTGFEHARQRALRQRKLMIVYVYTDWCPYCKQLDREVLSAPHVEQCLARTVNVRINPEHTAGSQQLAAYFGVTGYPSLFVYFPKRRDYIRLPTNVPTQAGQRVVRPEELAEIVCDPAFG